MDPSDFRKVGLTLGFTEAQLSRFEKDKLGNSMQATYQMLYEWRKTVQESEAREILVNKLESIELVQLADSVRKGKESHKHILTHTHTHASLSNTRKAYNMQYPTKVSTPQQLSWTFNYNC